MIPPLIYGHVLHATACWSPEENPSPFDIARGLTARVRPAPIKLLNRVVSEVRPRRVKPVRENVCSKFTLDSHPLWHYGRYGSHKNYAPPSSPVFSRMPLAGRNFSCAVCARGGLEKKISSGTRRCLGKHSSREEFLSERSPAIPT